MKKIVLSAALIVLAGAGVAAAQGGGQGGGMSHMINMADANHDGTITRAEFNAARTARFTDRDANHDGSLSADERPQWGGGGQGGGGQHAGGPMNADANNDGAISRAEYDAQGARMFDHMDADHDGSITQAEITAMQQAMQH